MNHADDGELEFQVTIGMRGGPVIELPEIPAPIHSPSRLRRVTAWLSAIGVLALIFVSSISLPWHPGVIRKCWPPTNAIRDCMLLLEVSCLGGWAAALGFYLVLLSGIFCRRRVRIYFNESQLCRQVRLGPWRWTSRWYIVRTDYFEVHPISCKPNAACVLLIGGHESRRVFLRGYSPAVLTSLAEYLALQWPATTDMQKPITRPFCFDLSDLKDIIQRLSPVPIGRRIQVTRDGARISINILPIQTGVSVLWKDSVCRAGLEGIIVTPVCAVGLIWAQPRWHFDLPRGLPATVSALTGVGWLIAFLILIPALRQRLGRMTLNADATELQAVVSTLWSHRIKRWPRSEIADILVSWRTRGESSFPFLCMGIRKHDGSTDWLEITGKADEICFVAGAVREALQLADRRTDQAC